MSQTTEHHDGHHQHPPAMEEPSLPEHITHADPAAPIIINNNNNQDDGTKQTTPRMLFSQELRQTFFPDHHRRNPIDSNDSRNVNNSSSGIEKTPNKRASVVHKMMIPALSAEAATKMVDIAHGKESWQASILHFLHTKRVQYTLAGLLLSDVVILFIELAVEAFSPTCVTVEKYGISCCPESNFSDFESEPFTCDEGLPLLNYTITCNPELRHRVEIVETVLFYSTISILGIFLVELTTLVLILGPREFFSHILHALDFVVVCVSFALEIAFRVKADDILQAVIGLLIFGRFWRFLRIGHGIFEAAKEVVHDRVERVLEYTEELEHLLQVHGIPLPEHELKERHSHGTHHASPGSSSNRHHHHESQHHISSHSVGYDKHLPSQITQATGASHSVGNETHFSSQAPNHQYPPHHTSAAQHNPTSHHRDHGHDDDTDDPPMEMIFH